MGRHECRRLGQIVNEEKVSPGVSNSHFSFVNSFRVLVTSDGSGLIETLKNTVSIHSIKKEAYTREWNEKGAVFTLYNYFEMVKKKKRSSIRAKIK